MLDLAVSHFRQLKLVWERLEVMEPERALGALIMVVPVTLVFLFAQRYIIAGISAGAVKE